MDYEIEEYVAASGKKPFADWLLDLWDARAQARIRARLRRAAFGNFGDWKYLSGIKGVFEMRENYGPGYRIYYSIVGRKIILLLAGSTKKDQNRAIAKAVDYLIDYERRMKQ
jgi:putative addiction module killer protein